MIWGETWDERADERHRKQAIACRVYEWFAWHPVQLNNGSWVWWELVQVNPRLREIGSHWWVNNSYYAIGVCR